MKLSEVVFTRPIPVPGAAAPASTTYRDADWDLESDKTGNMFTIMKKGAKVEGGVRPHRTIPAAQVLHFSIAPAEKV